MDYEKPKLWPFSSADRRNQPADYQRRRILAIDQLKAYYWLAKPGIVYGNALSAVAGFLLAASLKKKFELGLFLAFIIGVSLVIACGCVINNYIDRDIDEKMDRTRKRALVTGRIGSLQAIIYGTTLGVIGFVLLLAYVNILTAGIGATGLFFYLVMYGFWKRRSPFGTLVGSVSGAAPIVGGYTAVTDHLDSAALVLFLIMAFWQMPHFYAIAMYRLKDYKAAGLPVLPAKKGFQRTKVEILAYTGAFTLAAAMLTVLGYTGYIYLAVMLLLGSAWLIKGVRGFRADNGRQWSRDMFLFSLIVLLSFSVIVSVGAILP